jgi:hypothetical protein
LSNYQGDTTSAPNYFKGFQLSSATIVTEGTGMNTLRLVERAILLKEEYGLSSPNDQTWVVMDRDSFPQSHYDNAFIKGKANGIQIAFSNECLEVWFLLHFTNSTAAIPRKKLPKRLSAELKSPYSKGMPDIYIRLYSLQKTALKNSKSLKAYHKSHRNSKIENCCPATNIDDLVSELRKYI